MTKINPWENEPDQKEFMAYGLKKDYLDSDFDADVHGGVTHTGASPLEEDSADSYYVGFDCAHAGDYIPGFVPAIMYSLGYTGEGVYRDMNYVEQECRKLARQVKEKLQ